MCNYLKIFGLEVSIVKKHQRPIKDDTEQYEWINAHNLTYIVFQIYVERNVCSDIENISNTKTIWTTLETNFQSKGSDYLNNIFRKLDNLIISS